MSKEVIFTICAKNFIGLAITLGKSIKKFHPEVDFYIFVADLENNDFNTENSTLNIVNSKAELEFTEKEWNELTFKYDIVEFCTAIKPFCFSSLIKRNYNRIIYFDPDIFLFNKLDLIFNRLLQYNVVVVPHEVNLNSDNPQRGGVFNLGFIAVNNGEPAIRMLKWWEERLRNNAFADPIRGYFTDQKWMDHLPVILSNDELYVEKHLGLNYAPWNFHERQVIYVPDDGYYIIPKDKSIKYKNYELIFFHYSSFKYQELRNRNFNHKTVDMSTREPELYELLEFYSNKLEESNFRKYLKLPYSYDYFDNMQKIALNHRRIYSRLIDENIILPNPFISQNSFYKILSKNSLIVSGAINVERTGTKNIKNYKKKVKLIDFISKIFIKIIGHDKFSLLARFLIRYFHLHNRARIISKDFSKFDVKSF